MRSHSVTCHPAEVTFPPLPQPKLVLDLATPEGCKAELTWVWAWHCCDVENSGHISGYYSIYTFINIRSGLCCVLCTWHIAFEVLWYLSFYCLKCGPFFGFVLLLWDPLKLVLLRCTVRRSCVSRYLNDIGNIRLCLDSSTLYNSAQLVTVHACNAFWFKYSCI